MDKSDFASLKRGLAQVQAFKAGNRQGFQVHEPIDTKALRDKMNLTQAMFAKRLRISVATVRDWEQGRRTPDGPARTLLGMVAADPVTASRLLDKAF